jgi:tetratricopeptide (TPR) repeat protein
MKVAIGLLIALLLAAWGCAPVHPALSPRPQVGEPSLPQPVQIGRPCASDEAAALEAAAVGDPQAALKGAVCLIYLAERAEEGPSRLADIRRGRKLAEKAVAAWPESGLAHYLLAWLVGLEAEAVPLKGLELVRVLEREAQTAAGLEPAVDHGGPHRMLGEVYLRAPGFPVSLGDSELAVEHFRKAVAQAPLYAENRLGLTEALLAEEETAAACAELTETWRRLVPDEEDANWQRALKLQQRLCERLGPGPESDAGSW